MDLQAEIKNVKELEKAYLGHCNTQCNSDKAIKAFHAWHKAMLVLFNKVVPANNDNFQIIKKQRAAGNGYMLKSIYDMLSGHYAMLMDDVERGKFPIQGQEMKAERHIEEKHPRVFISHSSNDDKIILSFIQNVLVLGLGLPNDEIVFTSDERYGIVPGDDISNYIKRTIAHADVVLIMISEGYKKSEVCLNEMGAAWALDRKIIQVMLPDADFDELGWVINLKKAVRLTNKNQLLSLVNQIATLLNVDMAKHFTSAVSAVDDYLGALECKSKFKTIEAKPTTELKGEGIAPQSIPHISSGNPDTVVNEAINKLGEFTIKELQKETKIQNYHYLTEKIQTMVKAGELEELGSIKNRKYKVVVRSYKLF